MGVVVLKINKKTLYRIYVPYQGIKVYNNNYIFLIQSHIHY